MPQQLNEASCLLSSSDEEGFANSDEDADTGSAAEAVMENLSAVHRSSRDSIDDLSTSLPIVLFSHKAKLRRLVRGYWHGLLSATWKSCDSRTKTSLICQ